MTDIQRTALAALLQVGYRQPWWNRRRTKPRRAVRGSDGVPTTLEPFADYQPATFSSAVHRDGAPQAMRLYGVGYSPGNGLCLPLGHRGSKSHFFSGGFEIGNV